MHTPANSSRQALKLAESPLALRNRDAIAAIEGIDGVFIGPSDLSASMGHVGNPGHPEVQAAIERAIDRIRAAGKTPGMLTPDPALVRHRGARPMADRAAQAATRSQAA